MRTALIKFGVALILSGFAVITLAALSGGDGDAGVVVAGFVGPVPFGFTNSEELVPFLVLAVVGAALLLLFGNIIF